MATTISLSPQAVDTLAAQVRGRIIQPGNDDFDAARSVYNAMIERFPAVIIQCADAADVIASVRFGREHNLDISVRGGGHNVTGFGTNDGGLVLDLSPINNVHIDPVRKVARVGGGATFADLDHAAWAFGLATPGGFISTTGVAGLGLGGGFGHLTRRFGLVIDNMLGADVVTTDGRLVHASAEENPDLFWALRGGGGNFGVITSLELRLHDLPSVYGGPIFYPVSEGERVLRFFRDFLATAPREVSAFFGYHVLPPAPFVPESLHGQTTCALVVTYTGPAETAEEALRPVREAAPVLLDLAGPLPYPAFNSMFDALLPKGLHHYWKADFVDNLTDAAIAVHGQYGPQVANPLTAMHIYPLDGAVHDVGPDETAFRHRNVRFVHNIAGIDADPANMPERRQWVRDYWAALHPHSGTGAYVNFLMDEGEGRIRDTYGEHYPRLVEQKTKWDPDNILHFNQNIPPRNTGS